MVYSDYSYYFDIFLPSEQPTTCPKCGCRTAYICDLPDTEYISQLHLCLSNKCKFTFIVEDDPENFDIE